MCKNLYYVHSFENLLDNSYRFHVVAPSLPGFFLSGYPQRTGWTVLDTARVFNELMVDVLGYSKYAVQGGDWVCSYTS